MGAAEESWGCTEWGWGSRRSATIVFEKASELLLLQFTPILVPFGWFKFVDTTHSFMDIFGCKSHLCVILSNDILVLFLQFAVKFSVCDKLSTEGWLVLLLTPQKYS